MILAAQAKATRIPRSRLGDVELEVPMNRLTRSHSECDHIFEIPEQKSREAIKSAGMVLSHTAPQRLRSQGVGKRGPLRLPTKPLRLPTRQLHRQLQRR